MKPAIKDIEIRRNDTFRGAFRIWTLVNGVKTYTNLSGYVGKAQMRQIATSSDVLLEFDVQVDLSMLGLVRFSATPVQTAALPMDGGVYDLQLTSPSGDIDTFLTGGARVVSGVTRP